MASATREARMARIVKLASREGFRRAYARVRVNPEGYLRHVRRAHRLPVQSWREMFLLGPEIIDPIAESTVAATAKFAALDGMGMGLGGFFLLAPDMGVLAALTVRLLQKLSLLYGFEYATEEEIANLWLAAASAAGADVARDFLEKQAAERVIPRLVDAVAAKLGTELAEKWAARLVPVLSGAAGATLNYFFVRGWGRRAQRHFRARHIQDSSRDSARMLPGWSEA